MPRTAGEVRIHGRAMNRALARLRDTHRDEYQRYYDEEAELARVEAAEHLARVAPAHRHPIAQQKPAAKIPGAPGPAPSQIPIPIPPALHSGPRRAGEVAADRIREDVALCPWCQRYHDRGHECTTCRSRPVGAPSATRSPYARTR